MSELKFKALDEYLKLAKQKGASDIHIKPGSPIKFRINGELIKQEEHILTPEDTKYLLYQILSKRDIEYFEEYHDLDTSYSLDETVRFRVNCGMSRGGMTGVLRLIETKIRSIEDLDLPKSIKDFAKLKRGLVLVTGATGSGKSTTLAAIIEMINQTQNVHIVTIEDPIEYLYVDKKATITQREVGSDTLSFKNALRAALRQDPDIVLIGEMRDLETIQTAITMAETGHLVFATLHTNSASATIDRIIDVFPADQQNQIKTQLASVLQGIVCQALLPHKNGRSRVVVCEILKMTDATRAKIKAGNHKTLIDDMQTGRHLGMQTFDNALIERVREGKIDVKTAELYAHKPEYVKKLLKLNY